MLLDFTQPHSLPNQAEAPWQQEILDFVKDYATQNSFVFQTSGSTGTPKSITFSKAQVQLSAQTTAQYFDLPKGMVALLCLPIHYVAGKMMLIRAIENQWKLRCVKPKTQLAWEGNVDFAAMTPMQVEASMLQLPKIKMLILGGAPVSYALKNKLLSYPTEVYETYGMTETLTHVAVRNLKHDNAFHLLAPHKMSTDDRGCLVLETPYSVHPIITNDVVEIQTENTFLWKGRVDHVINSGGVKIHPEQVEQKLKPYINAPFFVHYLPDEKLGQKVILVIESQNAFEIDYPASVLTKYEVPKEIYFVKAFPRTASGKIQRKKLGHLE